MYYQHKMKKQEEKMILKDAIKKIKQLIAEEQWLDAHRACIEILRFDPDNIKIIRLKSVIEKNVKKINVRAIKEDLKKLQPLWDQKKYEELLEHLKDLEPYIPDYPPLKKYIMRARDAYRKTVEKEQKVYVRQELEQIKKLIEQNKYQEAIRNAEKLRIQKFNENEVKEWIKKIRSSWVENDLKQHETLLKSKKYEDIQIFLQKLKKIDPSNEKLDQLIKEAKKKAREYQIEQKRDFIFIGIEKTRTMIQLKKYGKAIEAAREILAIDPNNLQVKRLFAKASRKENHQINKDVVSLMKRNNKELKQQYKQNKKDFIRL